MKKKILIFLVVFLVLLFLASLILSISAGSVIKSRVINYAKDKLNLKVDIGSVDFNLLQGALSINDVTVKNPDGFKEKYLFSSTHIDVSFNLLSVFLKKIFIVKVNLVNPEFSIEKDKYDNSNLKVLMGSINEKFQEAKTAPEEKKPKKEDFKFLAERLSIKRGSLSFTDATITDVPNTIYVKDIFVQLKVKSLIIKPDNIPVSIKASAKLPTPNPGVLEISGEGSISKNIRTLNLEALAKNIDLDYIRCLLSKGLRNAIGSGVVDAESPIRYADNLVDSLVTFKVRDLKLKQTDEALSMLGLSVVKLLEIFKDEKGDIEFDLRLKGNPNNLRFSFGPLSQQKMTNATIDIIRENIEEAIKPKEGEGANGQGEIEDKVNRIKLFLDFKDKKKK